MNEPRKRDPLRADLMIAVENYVGAKIAESWKGGGDPQDIPEIEFAVQYTYAELMGVINKIFGAVQ